MIDTYKNIINVERAVRWLRSMLVVPDGSMGIYERYLINDQKVNHWVRPDCTMETARLFHAFGAHKHDQSYIDLAIHMADYVVSLQRDDGWFAGSFPFYKFVPPTLDEQDIGSPEASVFAFPNDTGKVAEGLLWLYGVTENQAYADAARRTLEFLMRIQAEDGTFSLNDEGDVAALKGADFVAWPCIALWQGAATFGEAEYQAAGYKALTWLSTQITPDWRIRTSYETASTEAWRPPSSELAIVVRAYAIAAKYSQDHAIWNGFGNLVNKLLSWQHASGAIRNCDETASEASQQNDPDVTDMVYTNGYALMALQDTYRANLNTGYRDDADLLAA
ncbi:MAG TPA: prenyltransferase/squalene oxidase repeat-containing protein, partial [Anaerolineae bacterium]